MLRSVIIGGLSGLFWVLMMIIYMAQNIFKFSIIPELALIIPFGTLVVCMAIAVIMLAVVFPNAMLTTDGSIAVPERIDQRGEAMASALGIGDRP